MTFRSRFVRQDISETVFSPALPIFILLYGIVILFAITYYMGMSWHRIYTISFYVLTIALGAIFVARNFQKKLPTLNRIDITFLTFFVYLLISISTYWWEGSIKKLQMMPFFLFAPYVLGRVMSVKDVIILRFLLAYAGPLLLLLIFPEYLRYMRNGYEYSDVPYPVLFGKNIGVMMSGLLMASSLLSITSILLTQRASTDGQPLILRKARYFLYLIMLALLAMMIWLGSRGPLLITIVGMGVNLQLTPSISWARKSEIIFGVALAVFISFFSMEKNASKHFLILLQPPQVLLEQTVNRSISDKQNKGESFVRDHSSCDRVADSVSERWRLIQEAIRITKEKALSGVGANQFGFYSCAGPGAFPHNIVLQVFSELGALVGALYCYLLWIIITVPKRLVRSMQKNGTVSLGCWLTSFSIMQILFALISGDYFVCAPVYFLMGLAASMIDLNSIPKNH